MSDDLHTISAGGITATIKADGAELCSLKTANDLELLWQAGAAWPRHAPWLFPIVGRLKNDQLHHGGRTYPMTQHGFARDLRFTWLERGAEACVLQLTDNQTTQARYPFAFRLTLSYRITADALDMVVGIANPGAEVLPPSFGAHPAFNWPLLPGEPKDSYRLVFAEPEPAPVRRLTGGLLCERPERSPIEGRVLSLNERLFENDAVILDQPLSRSVRLVGSRGPALDISWDGFRELGIWSKPGGAPFLCIEPWRGFASPLDFDAEFVAKPGIMHIATGAAETLRCRIEIQSSD
ncbi:aldose 1-epimerase family protein [Bradyrhizobium sp. 83002]|uniref:aldose 1-epimerase family protein n=1 Tax=Bradyrhizobium aeschynomenes TaxID=2734909 RepID=UPI00155356D2|nr:aldose 1-epimerase family protein [Bradyrhizobium aeschynomenes]NPU09973.1 aldose 1-epimerase family protein [Bradyrhizobium aeschynomenes]